MSQSTHHDSLGVESEAGEVGGASDSSGGSGMASVRRTRGGSGRGDMAQVLRQALDDALRESEDREQGYAEVSDLIARATQLDQSQRQDIATRLQRWPLAPRLAAELTIKRRLDGIPNRTEADILVGGLIPEFQRSVAFPPLPEAKAGDAGRAVYREQVQQWVAEFASRVQPHDLTDSSEQDISPGEYRALVCLLREVPVDWLAVYKLLDSIAGSRPSKSESGLNEESWRFLDQLSRALRKKRYRRTAVRDVVECAGPALVEVHNAMRARDVTVQDAQHLEKQVVRLRDELQARESEVGQLRERIAELYAQLKEARAENERAAEHFRAKEESMRIAAHNDMARTKLGIRDRVGHEAKEAMLALDGATPDLAMARRRLQRALEMVFDLGEQA